MKFWDQIISDIKLAAVMIRALTMWLYFSPDTYPSQYSIPMI